MTQKINSRMTSYLICILAFQLIGISLRSQNLEKIGQPEMMTISGGINFTSMFYHADGIDNRRDPFTQYASGNLTLNFLDVSMPVTFSYSNQKGTFTQPFNQFSISPTYKWIKTFMGFHALNYSGYTLAGHVFAGGGIELTPKNWKIGGMYGRLMQPVPYDEISQSDANLAYKRMGLGFTAGYEKKGFALNAILFHAADDEKSIPYIPLNTDKTPMENLAFSLIGKAPVTENLSIEGEYAISGITRNILSDEDVIIREHFDFGLFTRRTSTAYYHAYKSSINYHVKKFSIKAQFEHVDPDYRTLGGYFFNNDLENYTLVPSLQLLKGKLNMNMNIGFQRNNLDQQSTGTTRRLIGSGNIAFIPNQKWNINMMYSNFSTFTRNRIQPDLFFQNPLDTLNFYQVSRNASVMIMHVFGKEKIRQSLSLTGMHMVTSQASGRLEGNFIPLEEIPILTKIYNTNLGYNLNHVKSKTGLILSMNMNYSVVAFSQSLTGGPNVSLTKSFLNNSLRVMAGSTYNWSVTNSMVQAKILNHRITLSYQPKLKNTKAGRPGINLTTTLLQRLPVQNSSLNAFTELNGNLGISWSF